MTIATVMMLAAAAQASLCDRLATTVRDQGQTPARFAAAVTRPVGLATPAIVETTDATPSPDLAKRLAAAYPDNGGDPNVLNAIGPLWQASWVQGTLHCQNDAFFSPPTSAPLRKLADPAAYSDLCWTSSRSLGSVFGQSALIERDGQEQPYLGEDIVVTPWRAGWAPACGLAIRYDDRFTLTEKFCEDSAICAAGAAIAVRLATRQARGDDDKALQALVAPPPAVVVRNAAALAAASKRLSDLGADTALPTFGAKPKTEFPDYSDGSSRIMIVVDGTPLLARVGVGGVGWRAIGDHLIALYRFADGKTAPVASYVVAREAVGLRSVATYVPKPYVSDR